MSAPRHDRPSPGLLIPGARVHLVGVAGSGMRELAAWLADSGLNVTGSDLRRAPAGLADRGIRVTRGHAASRVPEALDALVYSAAVDPSNPERRAARREGLTCMSYAEALADVTRDHETVAVAGTHGKTSTAAMLTSILVAAGRGPSALFGGRCRDLGRGARVGDGVPFVVEACEAYRSFLELAPSHAIVTNVGDDHVEDYGCAEELRRTFREFVDGVPRGGRVVTTPSAALAMDLRVRRGPRAITVGSPPADVRVVAVDGRLGLIRATGEVVATFTAPLPGAHNALNAALAVVAAHECHDVPWDEAGRAVSAHRGVARRFDVVRDDDERVVIDDYAHHPAAIEATLLTARARWPRRRMVAVFQPHLVRRTEAHFAGFLNALSIADVVVLLQDYRVTGRDTLCPDGAHRMAGALRRLRVPCRLEETPEEVVAAAAEIETRGDVVVVMGAGDVDEVIGGLVRRVL